jgi:hypothetical protein
MGAIAGCLTEDAAQWRNVIPPMQTQAQWPTSFPVPKSHDEDDLQDQGGGFQVPTFVGVSNRISNADNKITCRRMLVDVPANFIIREQMYNSDSLRVFSNPSQLRLGIEELGLDYLSHNCFTPPSEVVRRHPILSHETVLVNVPSDFSNHSSKHEGLQNVKNVFLHDRKLLVTTRSIGAGEELFNDYTDYGEVTWFEDFLRTEDRHSIREFGHLFEAAH